MTGARSRSAVSPEHLAALNAGTASAGTLSEALVIDQDVLLDAVLPELAADARARITAESGPGILRRMTTSGAILAEYVDDSAAARLATHPSDTVRGWAAFRVGAAPAVSVEELLRAIRPFADDAHFTVREWSWMAVRPRLAAELESSIAALVAWTADPSERVRRFATESLRPRGVWAKRIPDFATAPERGLPLLTPLRADPSRMVQDSVANWLNDAAKTQPDWVIALTERWLHESPGAATARIVTRARRSLPAAR